MGLIQASCTESVISWLGNCLYTTLLSVSAQVCIIILLEMDTLLTVYKKNDCTADCMTTIPLEVENFPWPFALPKLVSSSGWIIVEWASASCIHFLSDNAVQQADHDIIIIIVRRLQLTLNQLFTFHVLGISLYSHVATCIHACFSPF